VGEYGRCSPSDFWELTIRQCNLMAEGVRKHREMDDLRMRRGWFNIMRSMGSKVRDERQLWPLQIDIIHAEMEKEKTINAMPDLYDFAKKTEKAVSTGEKWQ
jgi:hypothetical protein